MEVAEQKLSLRVPITPLVRRFLLCDVIFCGVKVTWSLCLAPFWGIDMGLLGDIALQCHQGFTTHCWVFLCCFTAAQRDLTPFATIYDGIIRQESCIDGDF